MDFLHDILALPGSVGFGTGQYKNNGLDYSNERPSAGRQDLFDPLRRLIRPSIDALGDVYRQAHLPNGVPTGRPTHDYRIQLLKLSLAQVGLPCIRP